MSETGAIKAELLCKGVDIADLAEGSVPVADGMQRVDDSFIHGMVLRMADGSIVNTSAWNWDASLDPVPRSGLSLPRLSDADGQLWITTSGGSAPVELLQLGQVSAVVTASGTVGSYVSLHSPTTLFAAPVRQCVFISMGKPCLYCTFEDGNVRRMTADAFGEALSAVVVAHPAVTSVALGGGTPTLSDMGASYYAGLTRVARTFGLEVSVELVPPPRPDSLSELQLAGASSLIMSLEVWDESSRLAWCLGKGSVSRDAYFEAWDRALTLLGPNRVASVLLVGAEPLESTLEGALDLVGRGVVPTLIPLRWYPDSRFDKWTPVDVAQYSDLASQVASALRRSGLDPTSQPGCTACGGCSVETDVVRVEMGRKV